MAKRPVGSIRPRGDGAWQLVAPRVTDPRTGRHRQPTKTFHGTQAAAEKELFRFVAESSTGHIDGTTATLTELLDDWMAIAGPNMSPSSVGDFRWYIDTHITPRIGGIQVTKLDAHHLQRLYADLRASGGRCRLGPKRKCSTYPCTHGGGGPLAAATVKRVHTILHAALEHACIVRWIARNPADDLRRTKQTKVKRAKPIPAQGGAVAQLTRWLEVNDPELWCFVVISSRRGSRPGETCALRWTDIDFAAGEICFARTIARRPKNTGRAPGAPAWVEKETKCDEERNLALVGGVLAAVQAHRRRAAATALQLGQGLPDAAFLFHHGHPERPWQPGNIARRLRRACVEAKVAPVTFRALRHYVATTLISKGEDPRTVAGVLGHSRASTTLDIYADWVPAKDRDAALLMDEAIDGADDQAAAP